MRGDLFGEDQRKPVVGGIPVGLADGEQSAVRDPVALDERQPREREADRKTQQHGNGQPHVPQVAATPEYPDHQDRCAAECDVEQAAEAGAGVPGPERRHGGGAGTREQQPEGDDGRKRPSPREHAQQRDTRGDGDDGGADVQHADRQRGGGRPGHGKWTLDAVLASTATATGPRVQAQARSVQAARRRCRGPAGAPLPARPTDSDCSLLSPAGLAVTLQLPGETDPAMLHDQSLGIYDRYEWIKSDVGDKSVDASQSDRRGST